MTTKKEIRLKTGETLPKGLPVSFDQNCPHVCMVTDANGMPHRVRVSSAFKCPSLNRLEKASMNGICPSVAGERVEPDGWDCHGSPSWLLALGMI
jgi:hypothetical protein